MSEVNTEFLDKMTDQVEGAIDCEALKEAAAEAVAVIKQHIDDAIAKLDVFTPYLELLELPTDPMKVLEYLDKLVHTLIDPIIKPIAGYQMQIAAYIAAMVKLVTAIERKAESLVSCSIPLPAIPTMPSLPNLPELPTVPTAPTVP
ncbi:MAG: hypothetical protein RLY58_1298 [Pseudomonadota bacterium]